MGDGFGRFGVEDEGAVLHLVCCSRATDVRAEGIYAFRMVFFISGTRSNSYNWSEIYSCHVV
jgi:hypothetical protein